MKRIITTLIVLMGYANFIAQAQNTEYSQSSSGIWFEVRTDSLNPCRYTEDNKIYQADREDTNQTGGNSFLKTILKEKIACFKKSCTFALQKWSNSTTVFSVEIMKS